MSHIDEGTLTAFLDRELREQEQRDIERHLAACGDCRARLEKEEAASRRSSELLAELEPGTVQAPTWRELEKRAAAGEGESPRRRSRPALAWAASVLLAFGIGWLSRSYWLEPRESTLVADVEEQAPPDSGHLVDRAAERESFKSLAEGAADSEEARPRSPMDVVQSETKQLAPAAPERRQSEPAPPAIETTDRARKEADEPAAQLEVEDSPEAIVAEEGPGRPTETLASARRPVPATTVRGQRETDVQEDVAIGGMRSLRMEARGLEAPVPVQPETASVLLGGRLRTLPHLQLQRIEVIPGSPFEGGLSDRSAIRLVYRDAAGHEVTLDQQLVGGRKEVSGDSGPTLIVEPDGRKTYRWKDGEGYLLTLQGEVSSDSLRALAELVE